ncbi:hypothetical protein [Ruminococcus sp.]
MMKEKYVRTELEVIRFTTGDVIMTSTENPDDEYELDRGFVHLPNGLIER